MTDSEGEILSSLIFLGSIVGKWLFTLLIPLKVVTF
nr:MAG TPA: hypothetical protein [Caudoviricetes sp.]